MAGLLALLTGIGFWNWGSRIVTSMPWPTRAETIIMDQAVRTECERRTGESDRKIQAIADQRTQDMQYLQLHIREMDVSMQYTSTLMWKLADKLGIQSQPPARIDPMPQLNQLPQNAATAAP